MTESGIAGLLSSLGVQISAGTISKLLLEPDEWACRERGDTLLSDDAPEYQKIARRAHALCWVHDARHYNKLDPKFDWHQDILENFKGQYWAFYDKLLA